MKKLILLLITVLTLSSCATSFVNSRITGNYIDYNRYELGKPNPYYYAALPFALVFDVVILPITIGYVVTYQYFGEYL